VEVEQGVQLVEAEPAVASEQREAGRAQRAAAQRYGVGLQGWVRWLVVARRAAAVAPVGAGPEAVAQRAELVEDLEAAGRQGLELFVDGRELVQEAVALDLELDACGRAEPGGVTRGELATRAEVWLIGGVLRHRVGLRSSTCGRAAMSADEAAASHDGVTRGRGGRRSVGPRHHPNVHVTPEVTHGRRFDIESTPMGSVIEGGGAV